jgi:hypothetical protein
MFWTDCWEILGFRRSAASGSPVLATNVKTRKLATASTMTL